MAQATEADPRTQATEEVEPDEGGMVQALKDYPAFRALLLGTVCTNTAFWMYQVAVGWLALEMTDSPLFVGLAGFAGGIPMLLLSLPAGVVIDRHDRRTILLLAQLGVLVTSAAFALLVGFDALHPWSLLALVAVVGTIMTFVFPVRTALVPSLVARKDLAVGVALNSAVQNATRVVGPSLAGVLIATIGAPATFAVAAVLQGLAMVATFRLPSRTMPAVARAGSGWESLTLGFRIVANSPLLLALVILALAPTMLVMPYLNLMPVFARDELGLGSTGLGVLLASSGLGNVAGSLAVAHSRALRRRRGTQVVTAVGFAVGVLAFAATSNVVMAVVLLFLAGWMSAAFLAANQTAIQLSVDDDVRGRVMSVSLLTWGMLPLGQLAIGTLASEIGTAPAMMASCATALACIAVIVRRFPALR